MNLPPLKHIVLLAPWFLMGCDLIQMKESPSAGDIIPQTEPIARAGESYLYEDDIRFLTEKARNQKDSAQQIENYINSWARKQLMIDKALSEIAIDEQEIERKILDYRYSLIAYQYQEQFIENNLDTTVSEEEIKEYYINNTQNFQLKQNIIKGYYAKLPNDVPRLSRFENLFRSARESDEEDLRSYCYSFATDFFLEDTVWVNFNELARSTPLANIPNKVQFLQNYSFYKTEDDDFLYYLHIKDFKITDEISPLEFVREQIRKLILLKRRVEIIKKLEENIYNSAIENENFEIYPR
jgi:hypothetical protein